MEMYYYAGTFTRVFLCVYCIRLYTHSTLAITHFVRYKTKPTLLCKDRRWCSGEGPTFWSPAYYWSRPMLFEKVEKKRIITFYFKTSTVDI